MDKRKTQNKRFFEKSSLFFALLILSIVLKIILSFVLTVHGDEGMYLYDSSLILKGMKPHVDYHTRSPVYLYILSIFLLLCGKSVFIGRLSSILASTITAIFIYKIGKTLFNKEVGFFSFLLFLFSPFTLMWSVIIATEIIQLTFVSASLYILLISLKDHRTLKWFVLSGLLVGLSIFTRRTSIIVLLCEVFLIFLYFRYNFFNNNIQYYDQNQTSTVQSKNPFQLKECFTRIILLIGSASLIFFLIFFYIVLFKGWEYALSSFLSSAGWGGSGKGDKFEVFKEMVERAYYLIVLVALYIIFSLKMILHNILKNKFSFYISLSIFFGLVIFSFMVLNSTFILILIYFFVFVLFLNKKVFPNFFPERYKKTVKKFHFKIEKFVLFFGGVTIGGFVIYDSYKSFRDVQSLFIIFVYFFLVLLVTLKTKIENKNKLVFLLIFLAIFPFVCYLNNHIKEIILILLISFTIFILFYMLMEKFNVFTNSSLFSSVSILLWFSAVFVFYLYYNMSQELFYYETSAAGSIMGGVVAEKIYQFRNKNGFATKVFFSLLAVSLLISPFYYVEYEKNSTVPKPWTVDRVAEYIKEHTEKEEEIFTANMAIAIEADRPIVMNLSHPTIYCKDYVKGFPDFSVINYPTPDGIIKYLEKNKVRFVVNDSLTNYYYFMFNKELRDYIRKNYVLVKEVNYVEILERSKEGHYRITSSLSDASQPFAEANEAGDVVLGYLYGKKKRENAFYRTIGKDETISPEIQVTPTTFSFSFSPHACIDEEGNVYFVWSEDTSTYSNIYFSKFSSDGIQTIRKRITSSVEMGTYTKNPKITLDSEGHIYILWSWAVESEGFYDIYYTVLDKEGNRLANNTILVNGLPNNLKLSLAVDQEDKLHVVWEEGRSGRYQIFYGKYRYNTSTKKLETVISPRGISSPEAEAVNPDIWTDNERLHVVWENKEESDGSKTISVHYLQMDLNGNIVLEDRALTYKYISEEQKEMRMVTKARKPAVSSQNGLTVIVWQDNRWREVSDEVFWNIYKEREDFEKRYWNIYYKVLDEMGNVIKNDTLLSYYESNSIDPDVSYGRDGFHIIWVDDVTKNYQILHKEINISEILGSGK